MGEDLRIVIRRMAKGDVPALVRLHAEVFEGYDNTMMGIGYLRGLYRVLSCHAACISIVALQDGEIVGWIGGVWDWLSFQKALIRRNILGVPGILLSILKNRPGMIAKAFSFVRPVVCEFIQRFKRRNVPGGRTPPSREAALLVVGVGPLHQNRGVGQSMMEGFNRFLWKKGFVASTVSTRIDNEAGNRAFQKAGYRLYLANGGVNFYIKHLSGEN